jgi:hypothetical protein
MADDCSLILQSSFSDTSQSIVMTQPPLPEQSLISFFVMPCIKTPKQSPLSTAPRIPGVPSLAPSLPPDLLDPKPTASTLLNHTQITTDEWFKSKKTMKSYASYVQSGKEWLKGFVEEVRGHTEEQGIDSEVTFASISKERSEFSGVSNPHNAIS